MIEGNAKIEGRDGTVVAATAPSASLEDAPLPKADRTGKSPAFQFYPKDFLGDEEQSLMSLAEAGAYTRLMCRCWLNDGIPNNLDELARLCGATYGQMVKFWPAISKCFKQRADGRWIHPRLEKERAKQADYRKRQGDRADKRWEKERESRNAMALQHPHSEGNALLSSSPISNLQSATTSKKKNVSPEPLRDSTPTAMTFTTVGALKAWDLTEGQISRWRESYPNLDVASECWRAKAWIEANPDKRKTAKGMPAFLVHWFNRTVDRPRALAATGTEGRGRTGAPPADKYAAFSGDGE